LITNGDRFSIADACVGVNVDVGDALFKIVSAESHAAAAASNGAGQEETLSFAVPLEHGIHARPAALIANFAKAQSHEITVSAHGRHAIARSAVSLMSLGVKHGDEIAVATSGAGALTVLEEL